MASAITSVDSLADLRSSFLALQEELTSIQTAANTNMGVAQQLTLTGTEGGSIQSLAQMREHIADYAAKLNTGFLNMHAYIEMLHINLIELEVLDNAAGANLATAFGI